MGMFGATSFFLSSLNSSNNRALCDAGAVPPPPPPLELTESSAPGAAVSVGSESPPPTMTPQEEALAAMMASPYKNPGPFEMASMDAKRLVMLDTFDGFRCDITKVMSPYMTVIHNFLLGTSMLQDGRKRSYAFQTQVADEMGLVTVRVDPERGSVDGVIQRALLGGAAMGKLQIGVSPEGQMDNLMTEVNIGAQTWTANAKLGSMGGALIYGCNYFQAITPKLSVGAESMYVGANQSLVSNYTARYSMSAKTGDEDIDNPTEAASTPSPPTPPGMPQPEKGGSSTLIGNFNAGQQAVSLNYKRVVTPHRVSLGSELQYSLAEGKSQVLLGAEFKFNRSKLQCCVDGGGRVQSVLEAKLGLQQGAPTISFAADVDHAKDDMKFGFGLTLES